MVSLVEIDTACKRSGKEEREEEERRREEKKGEKVPSTFWECYILTKSFPSMTDPKMCSLHDQQISVLVYTKAFYITW